MVLGASFPRSHRHPGPPILPELKAFSKRRRRALEGQESPGRGGAAVLLLRKGLASQSLRSTIISDRDARQSNPFLCCLCWAPR